jgi:hypothetical protein
MSSWLFIRLSGDSVRTMEAIVGLDEGLKVSMLVVLDVLGVSEEDTGSTGPLRVKACEVPAGQVVSSSKLSANFAELEVVAVKIDMKDHVRAELIKDGLTCRRRR